MVPAVGCYAHTPVAVEQYDLKWDGLRGGYEPATRTCGWRCSRIVRAAARQHPRRRRVEGADATEALAACLAGPRPGATSVNNRHGGLPRPANAWICQAPTAYGLLSAATCHTSLSNEVLFTGPRNTLDNASAARVPRRDLHGSVDTGHGGIQVSAASAAQRTPSGDQCRIRWQRRSCRSTTPARSTTLSLRRLIEGPPSNPAGRLSRT